MELAAAGMAFRLPALAKPSWAGAFLPLPRSAGLACKLNFPGAKCTPELGRTKAQMGLRFLPESPALPEGGDTYNSGFDDTDCLAESYQAQCTEASIFDTGDIHCRVYELHSGMACGFSGQAGIEEVEFFALPEVLGLDVSLDSNDGTQDLAAARPQALVHHLHRVLAEKQPVSPPAQQQRPLHGTPAQLEPPHQCCDIPPRQQYLSLARSRFVEEKGVRVSLEAVIHLGGAQGLAGVLGAACGVGGRRGGDVAAPAPVPAGGAAAAVRDVSTLLPWIARHP